MRKIAFIFCLLLSFQNNLTAHDLNLSQPPDQQWTVLGESVQGSFLMSKGSQVYLENANGTISHFPLKSFSIANQQFIAQKTSNILKLNTRKGYSANAIAENSNYYPFLMLFFSLTLLLVYLHQKNKFNKLIPFLVCLMIISFLGFTTKAIRTFHTITNPLTIDSAFAFYKPTINTFWDSTYFKVESKGIPAHGMMKGITGWQQQFPIPQCYTGNNAWSIPLNPTIALNPVPVNQFHFLKGAVAIAVNGVAIFNPYTNTGVDAFLDGQLDQWGGHCGRADDYHYHIAPLHLYSTSPLTFPIAYALDGFGVYGTLEPDGSNMKTLDANHGHYASNGVYHYHGTATAPYMIGNMVGNVTEDADLQIVPQSKASPIRPAGTPLKGAVITNLLANANHNGYALTYTLAGLTYLVEYEWNSNGVYTFKYTSPTGVVTNNVYNGFKQCTISTAIENNIIENKELVIFPNPSKGNFEILFTGKQENKNLYEVYVYDMLGKLLYQEKKSQGSLALGELGKGTFIVKVKSDNEIYHKKIIIN
jgi:hypothetical protein